MILQVGVKILLHNSGKKYLLLHRSSKKYPNAKGAWDIPGGRINPETSLLENLTREVLEETGLTILEKPQLIAAQDIFVNDQMHVVRLTYVGQCEGEVVLDKEEHDDYVWLTKKELEQLEDVDIYFKELLTNQVIF